MEMKSKEVMFSNQTEWQDAGKGMRRQILGYDESLMQVIVEFETGAINAEHSHENNSQTSFIVSGVFEYKLGNKVHLVKAGDGIYIAPNVIHGIKCIETGKILDSFSPLRLDFLGMEEK